MLINHLPINQIFRQAIKLGCSDIHLQVGRPPVFRISGTLTPLKMRAIFWPQATPLNPLPQLFVWDERDRLGVAGDWCGGPRVEGAFLSGQALAEAVLG